MNWRRVAWSTAFSIAVIALLAFGLTRDPGAIPSPLPGRPAPDFALPVMHGGDGVASLREHRGEIVVLNFFASWCLECRYEHGALSLAANLYGPRGVRFYGVLYNDTPAKGRAWIEEMGGQAYPALYDEGSRTAIDYGLYGVPETFIIGPDGTVVQKKIGPYRFEELAAALDDALAGMTPAGSEDATDVHPDDAPGTAEPHAAPPEIPAGRSVEALEATP